MENPTVIYSDASNEGWGAINKTSNFRTGGNWSLLEQELHINVLELKACQTALNSLCKKVSHCHVRLFTDNTTSCTYISKYGGKTQELDSIAI